MLLAHGSQITQVGFDGHSSTFVGFALLYAKEIFRNYLQMSEPNKIG
jgi:hypothetical protein